MIRKILALSLVLTTVPVSDLAQEKSPCIPDMHGTIRAKYEYEPRTGKGRFELRNTRISLEGIIIPIASYKAEIDLSDEGNIKMLDTYVQLHPCKAWGFTFGQMRVPFGIDIPRSPHLQYFANRSFIAKQMGDVRDVGIAAGWTFGNSVPVTLEGGIFNGSGLTGQKDFWTSGYNFSFRIRTMLRDKWNITLGMQKANTGDVKTRLYNGGTYFQTSRWHIEAEYLRKHYANAAFKAANAVDVFAAYKQPLEKRAAAISFLARYDYMSDHSKGMPHDNGKLGTDDPKRHRLTGGVTISLGRKSFQADIRVNYEQYFYAESATPAISERSKAVAELVVHF